MKIILKHSDISPAMNEIVRVIPKRATIPILSAVKLEASSDTLTIQASDLTRHIKITIPAEVEDEGSTAVNGQLFADLMRKQDSSTPIYVEVDDNYALKMKAGRRRGSMTCIPTEGMPEEPDFTPVAAVSINAKAFADTLSNVGYAASNDDARYYLRGTSIRTIGGKTHLTATDGHELATAVRDWGIPDGAPDIIISTDSWPLMARLLEGYDGNANVSWDDRKLRVTVGPRVFVTGLVDGTFPDFERVIPTQSDKTLVTKIADLSNAIQFCSTVADKDGRGRRVQMDLSKDAIQLSANGSGSSSNADERIAAEYDGPNFSIGCNPNYLSNAIGGMAGDTVEFRMNTEGDGIFIIDPNDSSMRRVVMPRQR